MMTLPPLISAAPNENKYAGRARFASYPIRITFSLALIRTSLSTGDMAYIEINTHRGRAGNGTAFHLHMIPDS